MYMVKSLANFCSACCALGVYSVSAAQDSRADGLTFDSQSFAIDRTTNLVRITKPRITQGGATIEADEALATGIDFDEQGEWQFKGHVRIEVDGAVLEADSALFAFDKDQPVHGDLVGRPATVEDRSAKRKEPVRGSANNLHYDYVEHTLHMSGNITLNKGQNTIRGCDLTYDFDDERFTAGDSADCSEPLRVIIQRQETAGGTNPAP